MKTNAKHNAKHMRNLKEREIFWQHILKTFYPIGLNEKEEYLYWHKNFKISAQSKRNILIFPYFVNFFFFYFHNLIFPTLYGNFNLWTFSLSLFERPIKRIEFNYFKWYEVTMFLLLSLSLCSTFNVVCFLNCP